MAINTPRVRSPELPQHFPWLNAERPIRLQELRGRVVILDFWTYGCINCLHELPILQNKLFIADTNNYVIRCLHL
jgi:thiol-disulfide isomerase/thioredoxin